MAKKPGTTLEEISAADITREAFSGPAIYASRFSVSIGGGGVRITGLEQKGPADPIHFRAAIQTSHQEAIELQKLLKRMLKETEAQIEKAAEEAGAEKETTETTEDV